MLNSSFASKAAAEMPPMNEMIIDQDLSCMIKRFCNELPLPFPKRRSSCPRHDETESTDAFVLTVRLHHAPTPCAFARPPHQSFARLLKV